MMSRPIEGARTVAMTNKVNTNTGAATLSRRTMRNSSSCRASCPRQIITTYLARPTTVGGTTNNNNGVSRGHQTDARLPSAPRWAASSGSSPPLGTPRPLRTTASTAGGGYSSKTSSSAKSIADGPYPRACTLAPQKPMRPGYASTRARCMRWVVGAAWMAGCSRR